MTSCSRSSASQARVRLFVSRFKTSLNRLELGGSGPRCPQGEEAPQGRWFKGQGRRAVGERHQQPHLRPRAHDGENVKKAPKAEAAAASAAAPASPSGKETDPKGPQTVGSFVGKDSPVRRRRGASSYGFQEVDDDRAQLRMLRSLELVEQGHVKAVKPKRIFSEVVLNHLFLRKYGLSREQRSQVIRSTGGSSRFQDVERVIRASDLRTGTESRDPPATKWPTDKRSWWPTRTIAAAWTHSLSPVRRLSRQKSRSTLTENKMESCWMPSRSKRRPKRMVARPTTTTVTAAKGCGTYRRRGSRTTQSWRSHLVRRLPQQGTSTALSSRPSSTTRKKEGDQLERPAARTRATRRAARTRFTLSVAR